MEKQNQIASDADEEWGQTKSDYHCSNTHQSRAATWDKTKNQAKPRYGKDQDAMAATLEASYDYMHTRFDQKYNLMKIIIMKNYISDKILHNSFMVSKNICL